MKTKNLVTILSTACLLSLSTTIFSQNSTSNTLPSNTDAFGKGTNVINLGIGLGGDYSYIGTGYSSSPNFVISYDNGTFGNVGPGTISLGGLLSYKGASYSYAYPGTPVNYTENWYYYILGFRSAYHWNFTSNPHFDPYAGLMLAYYDLGFKTNDPYYNVAGDPYYNTYSSYFGLSLYIGARYYVSPHVGFWLELGYGYTDLALGISFKF